MLEKTKNAIQNRSYRETQAQNKDKQAKKLRRWATRNPLIKPGEPRCSWRVSHSSLLLDTCQVTHSKVRLKNIVDNGGNKKIYLKGIRCSTIWEMDNL